MHRSTQGVLFLFASVTILATAQQVHAGDIVVQDNVTYRIVDGEPLKLDIARPKDAVEPLPLVVFIHGGGWHKGNRHSWRPHMLEFAKHGYVAATVSYRLAPKSKWPAQIEDVKSAVRFLRAHADEFDIDPDRVAVVGDSAGGQLALMLGLSDDDDFQVGENLDQSAKVSAVVNYFGSMDMLTWKLTRFGTLTLKFAFDGKDLDRLIESFLGTSDKNDPVLKKATPATYIDASDPPVLTFHGTEDVLVPIEEAYQFDKAMKDAGASHELMVLKGANHGWIGQRQRQTDQKMMEFLDSKLRSGEKAKGKEAEVGANGTK